MACVKVSYFPLAEDAVLSCGRCVWLLIRSCGDLPDLSPSELVRVHFEGVCGCPCVGLLNSMALHRVVCDGEAVTCASDGDGYLAPVIW